MWAPGYVLLNGADTTILTCRVEFQHLRKRQINEAKNVYKEHGVILPHYQQRGPNLASSDRHKEDCMLYTIIVIVIVLLILGFVFGRGRF
ncbi:MAG: hypothetical protein NVSMB52_00510 [Chloroflexota bacterium]